MTKSLQISGITQEEFANRVLTALEGFSQSPIVKRKQSVVNKAMVQILHGGNNVGQNEHNLSQFFEEKNNPTTVWIAQESYRHESDEDEMIETYEGATEEEALHQMKKSVVSYLSDWIEASIDVSDFEESMDVFEENPVTSFLNENDLDSDSIDPEMIAEMLKHIANNSSYIVLCSVFEYITNLMCVEGTHKVKETSIQPPKKENKEEEEVLTLYATKITFFQEDCDFDEESLEITECYVELDRKESRREDRLEKLLFQHIPDNDMSTHYLLEKSIIEDLLEQEGKDPQHFSHASVTDIIEWALSLVEASSLIDLIEEMTNRMVKVEIYNDYV